MGSLSREASMTGPHYTFGRSVDRDVMSMDLEWQACMEQPEGSRACPEIPAGHGQEPPWWPALVASSLPVACVDHETGCLIKVNQAYAEARGYHPREMEGMALGAILGPAWAERLEEIRANLEREDRLLFEATNVRKDGSTFPVLVDTTLIRDASGKPRTRFTCALDLTERKHVEEGLRQSERQYKDLFENMLTGVIVADVVQAVDGSPVGFRLVKANAASETLTGMPLKEWIGWTFTTLGELPEYELSLLYAVALEGKVLEYSRYNEQLQRHYEVRAYAPRCGQFAVMFHDVTDKICAAEEKAILQARLEHSQRMEATGRLAGGVAHDFNNMLAVILMNTEMGLEHAKDHPEAEKVFGMIRTAALHSADLTRQLLAFARQQPISPKIIDLNEAIAQALKMLRRLIGEGIEIVWRPGSAIGKVWVDPTQLDQLLANLLVNARDAIGARCQYVSRISEGDAGKGTITIQTGNLVLGEGEAPRETKAAPGEYVAISVSDDGCGMSPDLQARIFEPFFTTKEVGQGTGLGLATVYGVVRQNRGVIKVESVIGKGTTFRIGFPRCQSLAPGIEGKESQRPAAAHPGETVLVVEDCVSFLETITSLLESLGYRVLATSRPEQAMSLIEANRDAISLVLSDVTMPGMDGFALARQVQARLPNLRFLFMSGYPANVMAKRGMIRQDLELIQKPFTLIELARKLRAALDAPRDSRQVISRPG